MREERCRRQLPEQVLRCLSRYRKQAVQANRGPTIYFTTPPRAEDRVLSARCAADRTQQKHSWYRALQILRSCATLTLASLQPPLNFLRAVRAASLSVTCGPTLFISIYFIPLTGAADAASAVAVAAVGKITCACRHRRCGVGSSRWNINHAALRPRVLRAGTTS